MIELPEAAVLAAQITDTLKGRRIVSAVAAQSPHKFACYTGDPKEYGARLAGKAIAGAAPCGNHVEIYAGDMTLIISAPIRYLCQGEKRPPKHQLLLELDDGAAMSCTVTMWGVLLCVKTGAPVEWIDYEPAKLKPSPLTDRFDRKYFDTLLAEQNENLPLKAFLATKQRIPGLGNGVLQDILWTARLNPKRKLASLSPEEKSHLFEALKSVLKEMADKGGRDSEKDLFGKHGGYRTIMGKDAEGMYCPNCGGLIRKEAFLGGSVYWCQECQPV